MSPSRFLAGLVLGALTIGWLIAGSRALRRRLMPDLIGSAAAVADALAALALFVLTVQALGIFGLLALPFLVPLLSLVGFVTWLGARRGGLAATPTLFWPASVRSDQAGARATALVVIAALLASWGARVSSAYLRGMQTTDTLWYHMPWAARFAETGSILHLHYVDNDAITAFYPADSELLHTFGLLLFGTDLLSPIVNLGWAALGLTAAWTIGQRFGRAPHALTAAAIVLAIPAFVASEPGGAYNDVVCLALPMAGVAVLINGGLNERSSLFAASAAGLALGTKFTMILPALTMAVSAVVLSRQSARFRQAALWLGALLALGGVWYVRNFVAAGNPLPSLALHLGPISLPAPRVSTPLASVASSISDVHAWRIFILPGLQQSFGPAAWPMLIGALAGAVLALSRRQEPGVTLAGAICVVGLISFLFTPEPAGLYIFGFNVGRFTAPFVALGLVLFSTLVPLPSTRTERALLAVLLLIALATNLDPSIWPTGLAVPIYDQPVRGAAAIFGGALGIVLLVMGFTGSWAQRGITVMRRRRSAVVVAFAVAIGGGWLVSSIYAHHRYRNTGLLPRIYGWAQRVDHTRIGIVGLFLQYPLYGPHASNYVQYIGAEAAHGGFGPIQSCSSWRRAVNAGRFDWLVMAPLEFPLNAKQLVATEVRWTRRSPHAHVVISESARGRADTAVLVRISGPLDPGGCATS